MIHMSDLDGFEASHNLSKLRRDATKRRNSELQLFHILVQEIGDERIKLKPVLQF
jgi:hypothetical protein